ncbi:MAG TPA: 2-C-methyl-D-erythritol 4-phosphate cytidylyltransferase [Pseudomonadales bacterium]|nr:2-C-methyl-D-erythritol 4-phosphate cytidylyltransferase [Pseudomonadales bacterium]
MSSTPNFWAVIPAAGIGSRFLSESSNHTPKQYTHINGRTILEHSAHTLLQNPRLQKVVIALHANDIQARQLPSLKHEKVHFVEGGAERADSVSNALRFLRDHVRPDDWILVHDAARPCLAAQDLQKLIDTLQDDPVGGILAVPAIDTLKRVDGRTIIDTVDRSTIWQAQTPQMFRYDLLLDALQHAADKKIPVTDEASALEICGHTARVVEGSRSNIKITYPDDLALAVFYFRQQHLQGLHVKQEQPS